MTFTVLAEDAKHVNAFGAVIDYDPSHLEFVSAVGTKAVGAMENLTVNTVMEPLMSILHLQIAEISRCIVEVMNLQSLQ